MKTNIFWILTTILLFSNLAVAEPTYDKPETLKASDILPPELLSGPNHTIEDKVTNDSETRAIELSTYSGIVYSCAIFVIAVSL